jgi:hypothetical protein
MFHPPPDKSRWQIEKGEWKLFCQDKFTRAGAK